MSNQLTFVYWDVKGLAEPIRLLLHYAEIPFEDKRYQFGENATDIAGLKVPWFKEKASVNLGEATPLINLPYLIDRSSEQTVNLTQSTAILHYLAKKAKLAGEDDVETAKLEMIEQSFYDIRLKLVMLISSPSKEAFEQQKSAFDQTIPEQLAKFSAYLASKAYFGGEKLKWVDFVAFDVLVAYEKYKPGCLPTNLKAFQARISSLPTLQAYLKSNLNNKSHFAPIAHALNK